MAEIARRRRRLLLVIGVALAVIAALLVTLATRLTPLVRDRAVAALEERFDGEVQLDSLHVSIFPRLRVQGAGLLLRRRGHGDEPPLLRVGQFSGEAGLAGLLASPMRLRRVQVSDLDIYVPPRRPGSTGGRPGIPRTIVFDEILVERARLALGTAKAGRPPRVFDIHDLRLTPVGPNDPVAYEARLTNPAPRGEIQTTGRFGPWRRDEPSLTEIAGEYTFDKADLGTFKGIAGTLASTGRYKGPLERIAVSGETRTPDFQIDTGSPVPLTTRFEAVVDGTDGDTYLTSVEARIIESPLVARGAIAGVPDGKGREIKLDVTMTDARIQDVLRLAVKSDKPMLSGGFQLKAALLIPPGEAKVIDKMRLDGTFAIEQARFADASVHRQIETLSRRGRGKQGPPQGDPVASDMGGRFAMRNGRIRFMPVVFSVRGASVRLHGGYDLHGETLDFKGNLLLAAKLSETVSGWKSWIAKPFDPLFRDGNRTVLPITVTGSPSSPRFGLDVKRALTPGD